jgi:2-succinyl-6-hydroxy-2,4-cyclohexadiene-1-carboxylate synthase
MYELGQYLPNRIIRPDLIGHGRSPAPKELGPYQIDAMVEQLHRLVEDQTADRLIVCGYSMGARLALSYVVQYPKQVSSLVLIGGTPGIEDSCEAHERARYDAQLATRIETEGIDAFIHYWENLPIFASQFRLSPEIRRTIRRVRTSQRSQGIANHLRMAGTGSMPSLWKHVPRLSIPTLLITGSYDIKFRDIAEKMEVAFPSAKHESVPDTGHAPHVENPKLVAQYINEFLGEL